MELIHIGDNTEHSSVVKFTMQSTGIVHKPHCSAFMSVEEHNGELVGVVTANVHGQLTEDELEDLREYCTGQLSDGAGESLEQRPIKTPDGEIYISFWNSDKWFLQTEEEMNSDQFEDMTEEPDMGMTM